MKGKIFWVAKKKRKEKKKRVFEKKKIAHVFQAVLYIFLRALVEY